MRYQRAIAVTTKVNRLGIQIPKEALDRAAVDINTKGGFPILLDHDYEKFVGWVLEAKVCEFDDTDYALEVVQGIFETDEELKEYYTRLNEFMHKMQEQARKSISEQVRNKCILPERAHIILAPFYGIGGNNILRLNLPDIDKMVDEDELLITEKECTREEYFTNRFLHFDRFILYPSNYLRRSFSVWNNFNDDFLYAFFSLPGKKRIGVDFDSISFEEIIQYKGEFDYWWGPKMPKKIADLQAGVVVYGANEKTKQLLDIERSELFWYERDRLWNLEIEEISNRKKPLGSDSYACRYLHVTANVDEDTIVHCDGAIRFYTEEAVQRRLSMNLKTSRKAGTAYQKVWRYDEGLPFKTFVNLATSYFRNNPDIYSYFSENTVEEDFNHKIE